MMERLSINGNASHHDTQQSRTELRRKGLRLVRRTKNMTRTTEQLLQNLNISEYMDKNLDILDALDRSAKTIEDIVASMVDTREDLVMARISSLGQQDSEVKRLLSYFKSDIKAIVQGVLSSAVSGEPRFLRVLEKCYKCALDDMGVLSCDRYFDYIDEVSLASPYDPDYESEQFYEHEDRLQIDQKYAARIEAERERKYTELLIEREHTERVWIGFWSQALQKCPGGPTLFLPTGSLYTDTPRYLFRAFDSASFGRNDDIVIASAASVFPELEVDHISILSLPQEEGSKRLGKHLWNKDSDPCNPTNLVSWSSSLLFVVQYAIWRSEQRGWDPEAVHICAIDTSEFPRGQFARDMWLIHECHDTSETEDALGELIQLRKRRGYYNGEHLSQGAVHHKGRSCVITLKDLIDAGLHKLYPDFDNLEGRKGWTKRVFALRSKWAFRSSTTQEDFRLAIQLAQSCFPKMPTLDIALMFLTFKERKVRGNFRMRMSEFDSHNLYIHWTSLKWLCRYCVSTGSVRYP